VIHSLVQDANDRNSLIVNFVEEDMSLDVVGPQSGHPLNLRNSAAIGIASQFFHCRHELPLVDGSLLSAPFPFGIELDVRKVLARLDRENEISLMD
jgi:hypothetical protein